nr:ectonucleoside triphosphate diphosphohydrolase 4 isoform X6 [Halichoerus grypus]
MRDKNRKPVVMKIKPGISEFATSPEKVSDYISPLLNFAAEHVPRAKHKETPLYILCTAGMRILPESQQKAILEDLLTDIPVHFDFLFSDSHAEVISGKQEGVYAWIGINFVLGRFEHIEDDEDAVVEVNIPGSESREAILRKRTAGILDMGGVSTQIAYEVPKTVSFASSQQEEVAKNLLAEFNLGCDVHQTEHVYRVYVATFLGFGGNAARQRYEDRIFASTVQKNRLLGKQTGLAPDTPYLDPCLPLDIKDEIQQNGQTMYLRGTGDFDLCRETIQPFMNKTNETQTSLNGIYQPPIHFQNSEFYGFSEFYYCTEDVLRMGGDYNAATFTKAAKDYCATKWSILRERFDRGLYASHADLHRLKYQCFKSAWMFEVFHRGFSFPVNYKNLKTALQVYDKEVQWTLGAILYRTRFLPLRLLPGGRALHPAVPAAAPAHSQTGTAQRFDRHPLAGGRPSVPEDCRYLVSGSSRAPRDFLKEKPFFASGFLLFILIWFCFSFPNFCSLKQKQNPLFVSSAVPEVLRLAVLHTALN